MSCTTEMHKADRLVWAFTAYSQPTVDIRTLIFILHLMILALVVFILMFRSRFIVINFPVRLQILCCISNLSSFGWNWVYKSSCIDFKTLINNVSEPLSKYLWALLLVNNKLVLNKILSFSDRGTQRSLSKLHFSDQIFILLILSLDYSKSAEFQVSLQLFFCSQVGLHFVSRSSLTSCYFELI